jgi:hypothetical protein
MRAAILVAVGCTTHHHVTAGPTASVVNDTRGAEITGEVTGGDGLITIAGATARAGHDINGVAVRVGLGLEKGPKTPRRVFAEDPEPSRRWSPLGVRGGVTIGPTFYDQSGSTRSHFEARGAVATVWSFAREPDPHSGYERRLTLGLELFASTIGLSNTDVLIGIGITIGAWEYGSLAIAASRRARRLPVANRD